MAMRDDPDDPVVRITILCPKSERDAFDKWVRYGGPERLSMNGRIRTLMAADAADKIPVSRKDGPVDGRTKANRQTKTAAKKPRR